MAGRAYSLPRLQQALRALALLVQRGDEGATRDELALISAPEGRRDAGIYAVLDGLESATVIEVVGAGQSERLKLFSTHITLALESPLEVQALCSIGLLLPELADQHPHLQTAQQRSATALGAAIAIGSAEPPALADVRAAADTGRRATFHYLSRTDTEAELYIGWIEDCRLTDGEWRFDLITDVRRRLRVDRIIGVLDVDPVASTVPTVTSPDTEPVTVVVRCHRSDLGVFTSLDPDVDFDEPGDVVELTIQVFRPDLRLGRILLGCLHPVEVVSPAELAVAQSQAVRRVVDGYQAD